MKTTRFPVRAATVSPGPLACLRPLLGDEVLVFFEVPDGHLERVPAEGLSQDLGTPVDDRVDDHWFSGSDRGLVRLLHLLRVFHPEPFRPHVACDLGEVRIVQIRPHEPIVVVVDLVLLFRAPLVVVDASDMD